LDEGRDEAEGVAAIGEVDDDIGIGALEPDQGLLLSAGDEMGKAAELIEGVLEDGGVEFLAGGPGAVLVRL
jgi:hypothetical protein